jgi:hypothetical protein
MPQNPSYDLKPVHAPRLRGAALRLVVALLERPAIRSLIAPWLTANLGLRELRVASINESPTFMPLHTRSEAVAQCSSSGEAPHQLPRTAGFRFRGILDYYTAYRNGAVTPEQVAERALEAIAASDRSPQPLGAVIACRGAEVMAAGARSYSAVQGGTPAWPARRSSDRDKRRNRHGPLSDHGGDPVSWQP